MNGMLKKDLMLTWKNMKSLLLALVVFLVVSFSQTEVRVLLIGLYLCLLGVLTPIYAFSYDKLAGWDGYARALPVSRWKIVLAKYLLGVVFLAAALVVGVLIAVGSKAAGVCLVPGRLCGGRPFVPVCANPRDLSVWPGKGTYFCGGGRVPRHCRAGRTSPLWRKYCLSAGGAASLRAARCRFCGIGDFDFCRFFFPQRPHL